MKAVVFLGQKRLEFMEYPDPTPGPDEVVVKIRASGMCGSDLHDYRGPELSQLHIAGHEPCGELVELGGGVRGFSIGDRVMVHHYDGCHTCEYCLGGWTQMCEETAIVFGGHNGDGAHARYMKVPAHTLVRLPDSLSFKAGAAVSCGTGTAYGALQRLELKGDETLAVFGQGPVGLSATLLGHAMGARVVAIDVQNDRLELAKHFGADLIVNPAKEDAVKAIREFTAGKGAQKSMDCSSNSQARIDSVRCLKKWGTSCLVGVHGDMNINVNSLIFKQTRLIGSWTFSKQQQLACAEFIASRRLDVDRIFSHEFALEQAVDAYRLFDAQEMMGKGVFTSD